MCQRWSQVVKMGDLSLMSGVSLTIDIFLCLSESHWSFTSIFFSKVTGVNHKIKFPAPRAHTVALRLA